jgi:hypothetical protein
MTEQSKTLYWIEPDFRNPEVLVLDDTEDLYQQVADYFTIMVYDQSPEGIEENGPMFTANQIREIYPLAAEDSSGREYEITLELVPTKPESRP